MGALAGTGGVESGSISTLDFMPLWGEVSPWARKHCQQIGIITLAVKPKGKHSAGTPHAVFDVAVDGKVLW